MYSNSHRAFSERSGYSFNATQIAQCAEMTGGGEAEVAEATGRGARREGPGGGAGIVGDARVHFGVGLSGGSGVGE